MTKRPTLAGLHILVVEDDRDLAGFIATGLTDEECKVTLAYDGGAGLLQAERHSFDLILLDVMLPVINGFEVSKRLRLQKVRTPILLLTARDAPSDVVAGLDAGADDYLAKPFVFDVLLARIRARTRSVTSERNTHLRFADLSLDVEKHEARRGGRHLELTQTEFAILTCLMRATGRVVSRNRIIESVGRSGSQRKQP